MRDSCLNYPWYCDACDLESWNPSEFCWTCPFDDALSELSVLEAGSLSDKDESL